MRIFEKALTVRLIALADGMRLTLNTELGTSFHKWLASQENLFCGLLRATPNPLPQLGMLGFDITGPLNRSGQQDSYVLQPHFDKANSMTRIKIDFGIGVTPEIVAIYGNTPFRGYSADLVEVYPCRFIVGALK